MRALVATLFLLLAVGVAAQSPAPVAPAYSRFIYLVRHGQYTTSPADDENGGHLTPLGLAQARLVAARLRGLPVKFSSLHASTMNRARETAELIRQMLPETALTPEPLLRECTPRTWRTEVTKDEKPADLDAAERQLNAAFAKFFVPATNRDEHDILVCHGNVTRYFVTKALGVDTQAWLGMSVAHCSLTVIQVKPDGTFRVTAVGDIGHIPPNLQSGAVPGPEPQLVAP